MSSRMEKYGSFDDYDNVNNGVSSSRVSKNTTLYENIKSNEINSLRSNSNVRVIQNEGKTIDIDKIKRYIEDINSQPRTVRTKISSDFSKEENIKTVEEPKNYDLISVLERAKETREIDYETERYKKLRDTQYDILKNIQLYSNKKVSNDLEEEFNTDERTLIDLINTVSIKKEETSLLSELMSDEQENTTENNDKEKVKEDLKNEILKELENKKREEEITKTQELTELKEKNIDIDKSFYTNSLSFSKQDFDGFDEIEKSVKKNSTMLKISVVIIVLFIIATLIVVANYVFELGLF